MEVIMKTYLLRDIDETLWNKIKVIAKKRRFSLRVIILTALAEFDAKHSDAGSDKN